MNNNNKAEKQFFIWFPRNEHRDEGTKKYCSEVREVTTKWLQALETDFEVKDRSISITGRTFEDAMAMKGYLSRKIQDINALNPNITEVCTTSRIGIPRQQCRSFPQTMRAENNKTIIISHEPGNDKMEFFVETACVLAAGNLEYEKSEKEGRILHKNRFETSEMAALLKYKIENYPFDGTRNIDVKKIKIEFEKVQELKKQLSNIKIILNN